MRLGWTHPSGIDVPYDRGEIVWARDHALHFAVHQNLVNATGVSRERISADAGSCIPYLGGAIVRSSNATAALVKDLHKPGFGRENIDRT